MLKSLLFVFIGGGLGSCLRFAFSIWLNSDSIKWIPTLTVNVLGCLILGSVLALNDKSQLSESSFLLLAVGFCGGLTTFSTFSAELYFLLKQTAYLQAALYFMASTLLGITAIMISYQWIKSIA
ncbi:fluoride efflux transporter CrcB [Nonlabens agnitus]|uniref:Fluoride-specific ion channel FluC n=1 Tax=Nonlabens agnitus TaxID=870484 RepID=A0A2S9WTL5_9FLAO|nr:fluoride efflux transporter CrcB [Nonlabens agnitus]PRP66833.1 CrcB protein [Nonlabens agnitus]